HSTFPNLLFAALNGDCRGAGELHVEVFALTDRRRAAVAGHHRRRAAGRAGDGADCRSLAAPEDGAENRAADRGAADLLAARARPPTLPAGSALRTAARAPSRVAASRSSRRVSARPAASARPAPVGTRQPVRSARQTCRRRSSGPYAALSA